jgi:PAS domain S-box-containing protein
MRLSWKIYLLTSSFALLAACMLSAVMTYNESRHAINELRTQQRLLASLAASQVEVGYHEQLWPFEMLAAIGTEKSVIAWHILDGAGRIVLSHHKESTVDNEALAHALNTASTKDTELIFINFADNHSETVLVPMRMRTEAKPWRFALTYWKGGVLERINARRTTNIFIAAGVILSILPLSLWITRRFLKPLELLTNAVRQMKQGESEIDLPAPTRDEVGELIHAFHEMTDSIQQRDARIKHNMEVIQQSRDDLEMRIDERTADLMARTNELESEIIERRRIEMALREAEHWLRTLIDNAPEAIVILDPATECFIEVNDNATQLYGLDRETLYTLGPAQVSPDRQPAYREPGNYYWAMVEKALADEIPCEVRLVKLSRDGKQYIRGSVTDISARKEAEERLRELNERLIDASRKAGMAEVASSVLHNVGNVLNSVNTSAIAAMQQNRSLGVHHIRNIADLLCQHKDRLTEFFSTDQRGQLLPEFLDQLANHMDKNRNIVADHLKSLSGNMDHIKHIVRMQQNHAKLGCYVESIDLKLLIENGIGMVQAGMDRHGIEIVRQYGNMGTVNVDQHRVLQILVNLLNNSKQAMKHIPADDKRVTILCNIDSAGWITIEVMDNGMGIAQENLDKIFQYSFSTRKSGHGFGLHGSSLAAIAMEGKLEARSDGAGKGAAFTLRIPQLSTEAERQGQPNGNTLESDSSLEPCPSIEIESCALMTSTFEEK